MARANSTIRVNIIGDAQSLARAADKSEAAVGGIGKKAVVAGSIIAGAFATDQLLDFGQTALQEADRVGDATGRLEDQLGDLADPLVAAADEFDRIGASEGDMLTLAARIADIGTAAGIADAELAPMAQTSAETAAALALITDIDADFWIDAIGKAAAGSDRSLRELGVGITDAEVEARALAMTGKDTADALTDGELAAARLELILEKLAPRIAEVTTGTADLEQRQSQLQARWETLTGDIGDAIDGPLTDLLGWVLTGIDGWALLSERIGGFDRAIGEALTPVARMIDLQRELIGVLAQAIALLNQFAGAAGQFGADILTGTGRGTPLPRGGLRAIQGQTTINVQGGSPEAIEQAVRNALRTAAGRGPLE
jgi:hypothetical protein